MGELGIPIIECADYMETSPLGRAEWVRFYGMLFGKQDVADKMFAETESNYLKLKQIANGLAIKPKVIIDQRYGQVWNVPGGVSTMGRLIEDAGGINPFASYERSGSVPLAPEKVLAEAHDADVWFVRYNQEKDKSLRELGNDAPVNSQFKAFKDGRVYGCNTRYVNSVPSRPHSGGHGTPYASGTQLLRPGALLQPYAINPRVLPYLSYEICNPFNIACGVVFRESVCGFGRYSSSAGGRYTFQ